MHEIRWVTLCQQHLTSVGGKLFDELQSFCVAHQAIVVLDARQCCRPTLDRCVRVSPCFGLAQFHCLICLVIDQTRHPDLLGLETFGEGQLKLISSCFNVTSVLTLLVLYQMTSHWGG